MRLKILDGQNGGICRVLLIDEPGDTQRQREPEQYTAAIAAKQIERLEGHHLKRGPIFFRGIFNERRVRGKKDKKDFGII
jgi:hypothetical protein